MIIVYNSQKGTHCPSKSPLSHGIKDTKVGDPAGQKIDRLGIQTIIIEDEPKDDGVDTLLLSQDKITLESAEADKGMKTDAVAAQLHKKIEPKATIISIGLGGERR
jgi:aldehyde:ferredoxin oxidoreductase